MSTPSDRSLPLTVPRVNVRGNPRGRNVYDRVEQRAAVRVQLVTKPPPVEDKTYIKIKRHSSRYTTLREELKQIHNTVWRNKRYNNEFPLPQLTSTRVEPGTGTGVESRRNIHVSISRTSCNTIDGVASLAWPVNTVHTLSRLIFCEAPTRFGDDDSLQASMSFFNMNRHSRNVVKNGWCEMMQSEVNDWLRSLVRLREARGDGEWLPPDSESADGAIRPSLGTEEIGCPPPPPFGWCAWKRCWSESRRDVSSRSESLGATLLL